MDALVQQYNRSSAADQLLHILYPHCIHMALLLMLLYCPQRYGCAGAAVQLQQHRRPAAACAVITWFLIVLLLFVLPAEFMDALVQQYNRTSAANQLPHILYPHCIHMALLLVLLHCPQRYGCTGAAVEPQQHCRPTV
jgi:hypothetical protein